MLSVIMLIVVFFTVMLSVIMLSVVGLIVIAPGRWIGLVLKNIFEGVIFVLAALS